MTPLLLISTLLIAGAVGAVVFAVASQFDERQMVRNSLRQLDGYEVENKRDQELLDPLRDRALKPLMDGLSGLGKRFTPVGYIDKVREKFIHMGQNDPDRRSIASWRCAPAPSSPPCWCSSWCSS